MNGHRTELVLAIGIAAIALAATVRGVKTFAIDRAREVKAAPVREKLFAAIQPVNVTNCSVARFGDANDGGYLVCANLLGAVKTGYSYGINGTDEWGCQLAT